MTYTAAKKKTTTAPTTAPSKPVKIEAIDYSKLDYDKEYYEDILRKSRIILRQVFPYFTTPMMALRFNVTHLATDFSGNPTFAVDKNFRMYAHPAAIERWISLAKAVSPQNPCKICGKTSHNPFAIIAGVLVHEMMHPLRKHFLRAQKLINNKIETIEDLKKAAQFNIAADLELNDNIIECAKLSNTDKVCLFEGVYYPQMPTLQFPNDLFMEEYYELLNKKQDQVDQEQAGKCGSGADGIPRAFDGSSKEGDKDFDGVSEAEADAYVKKAAKELKEYAAQNPGKIPSSMERWADTEIEPAKYNWRRELDQKMRYHSNRCVNGYKLTTYARRNVVSTILNDVAILPSYKRPLPNWTIIVDTSGSMCEVAGRDALSEAEGLLKILKAKATIISCDAAATVVGNVKSMKHVKLVGGGGTILAEGIKLAMEQRTKPDAILVLSDGHDCFQMERPKNVRVIVGLVGHHATSAHIPSWMDTVFITKDEEPEVKKGK